MLFRCCCYYESVQCAACCFAVFPPCLASVLLVLSCSMALLIFYNIDCCRDCIDVLEPICLQCHVFLAGAVARRVPSPSSAF